MSNSTRVSNELGALNPKGAQLAVRVSMFLAISEAALVSCTLLALRHVVGYAYSSEKEVVIYVKEMVPLVCLSVITDNLQGVLSGSVVSFIAIIVHLKVILSISAV